MERNGIEVTPLYDAWPLKTCSFKSIEATGTLTRGENEYQVQFTDKNGQTYNETVDMFDISLSYGWHSAAIEALRRHGLS